MKIPLFFIVFVLLSATNLRPAIAGLIVSNWRLWSLQLRSAQPPIEKHSFTSGIMTFSQMQKKKRKGVNDDYDCRCRQY
ncbi:MAG: hypothetical protein EGQ20_14480 [Bacteroides oleiciplenus]|nr:hypothetical protein [Bacteroides oleiciplenus]